MPAPSHRLALMMAEAHNNLAAAIHESAVTARQDIGRMFSAARERLNRSAGQHMRYQKKELQHGIRQ